MTTTINYQYNKHDNYCHYYCSSSSSSVITRIKYFLNSQTCIFPTSLFVACFILLLVSDYNFHPFCAFLASLFPFIFLILIPSFTLSFDIFHLLLHFFFFFYIFFWFFYSLLFVFHLNLSFLLTLSLAQISIFPFSSIFFLVLQTRHSSRF